MRELNVLRLCCAAMALTIIGYLFAANLTGCKGGAMNPEQVAGLQSQIDAAKTNLSAQQAQWQQQLAAAEAQNNQIAQEAATKALATITQLQTAADKATQLLKAAQSPDGSINPGGAITGLGAATSPFVPPGTQPVWLLATAVVGAIVNDITRTRAQRAKTAEATAAASSLVNGMDKLFIASPEASKAFDDHAGEVHEQLTPFAASILNHESIT